MSWKAFALQAHRWLGLVAALFLSIQAATGLCLVFREDLNALLQPAAFRIAPYAGAIDVDGAADLARARHPGFEITRLDLPARPDRAVVVRLAGGSERMVTINPGRGAVLADAPRTAFPVQWLYELHTQFLSGETGRWVIAANGLALVLLALTGPLVWWPAKGRFARALKPPALKGPAFRLVANLHRFAGVYLCLLLFLVAATGLTLVFFKDATKLVAAAMPTASPPKLPPAPPGGGRLIPLNAVIAQARAEAPGLRLKSLRLSGPDGRMVRAVFQARGGHARNIDQVWIDRAGGAVLDVQRAAQAPAGSRLLSWVLPLHAGEAYRWAARPVSLTVGAALLLFALSGAWLYLRRALPRRVRR